MSVFNVFFDSPAQRPFQTHRSKLDLKRVRVSSQGHRATVAVGDLTIGPFAGEWQLTFYRGARLVHVEAVVTTDADRTAFLYDTGLASESPQAGRFPGSTPRGSPGRPSSTPPPRTVRWRSGIARSRWRPRTGRWPASRLRTSSSSPAT